MPHDFVVLSTMRCGSYHLTSLLDSAPDLTCLGEIYKPRKVELPRPLLRKLRLKLNLAEERNAMGPAFLERLAAETPNNGFGFKLFPFHVPGGPPFLRPELFSGRRRIIALTRPALEVAVSLAVARANGGLTQKTDAGAAQKPVPLAPHQIEAADNYITRLDSMRARLSNTKRVALFDITYADLSNPERVDAALAFLGSAARASDLQSEYHKQGRGDLHERITNWPEVVATLKATEKTDLLAPAGYRVDGTPN